MAPSNNFVSFSKRRKGLFSKAADFCVKCNAKIAIIVLSPTGNPYAFGHSSVEEVLGQYCPEWQNKAFTAKPRFKGGFGEDWLRQLEERVEAMKEECGFVGIMEWIEKEWESRQSVEELKFLKQKYLMLLELVSARLITLSSQ